MRLTLEALETLDAIEAQGSFAGAAEVLHRVPSAITYTVQKLEADLGVALFDRSGRRAKLTSAGRVLLERGRELLRQAESLENLVMRAAHGWETQLTLAVDELLPMDSLFPVIAEFDAVKSGTRLRFSQEVFGGAWDALIDRRAELSIGAAGDPPPGYGIVARRLGSMRFVFACAPQHPLARLSGTLTTSVIARYRSIAVADSSRRLPTRSGGIQPGQEVLVVPSMAAKLAAQLAGLGVGYLPEYLARPYVQEGRLVACALEHPREPALLNLAWREGEEGRALNWFVERLLRPDALSVLEH